MPSHIRIEGDNLHFECPEADFRELRLLEADAGDKFAAWIARYDELNKGERRFEDALKLGREIYSWLDGDQAWLRSVQERVDAPWIFEIRVVRRARGREAAFHELPWELLAGEDGFLAADTYIRFAPYRRIGTAREQVYPSDYRLSLLFMAAAPKGQSVLDFEGEESAVLNATQTLGLDLSVEESGCLRELQGALNREGETDVMHLSCHGTMDPVPALALEDEVGNLELVTLEDFVDAFNPLPKLLFLSACHSADSHPVTASLSAHLCAAGFPAVLGWGGAVGDREASLFASVLYEKLAGRRSLQGAVAEARYAMFDPGRSGGEPAGDWHLARLTLGAHGGGALCRGGASRHRAGHQVGHKEFLDAKDRKVPVAGRHEFVGRRRQLQRLIKFTREGGHGGALISGMGKQGKSSLAARLANRVAEQHKLAVVFGDQDAKSDYGARAILSALDRYLDNGEISARVKDAIAALPHTPQGDADILREALREILNGACRELRKNAKGEIESIPVLLVLDDFERALDDPRGKGRHTLKPELRPVIAAVIRAFRDSGGASRLLITSRYQFTLPQDGVDLADALLSLPLRRMDEQESFKQVRRKLDTLEDGTKQKLLNDGQRLTRCQAMARGNPGLQDTLLTLALNDGARCDQALSEMQAYLDQGAMPEDEKTREFLQNLTLEKLLALLRPAELELLRASTLFDVPVPRAVMDSLAEPEESGERLSALGLWESYPDAVDANVEAVMVNALTQPLLTRLSEDQETALARRVLEELYAAWGGEEGGRGFASDYELTRLALLAENGVVAAATAGATLYGLRNAQQNKLAAALARALMSLLDVQAVEASIMLLTVAGESCNSVGEAATARAYYARALKLLESAATPPPTLDHAKLLLVQGESLARDGEPDQANEMYARALALLDEHDFPRERAVTQGKIADILMARGKLDEALEIRTNEQLPVYEKLGDTREQAGALWEVFQIYREKNEIQQGVESLSKAYQLLDESGYLDGIAAVGIDMGQILVMAGHKSTGLAMLQRSHDAFVTMGMADQASQVRQLIARIKAQVGEPSGREDSPGK